MSPLEILARQLDNSTIDKISHQVGASPQQTQVATAGIVETLLGAMARNVQQNPQNAQRIERALQRDNHASLLDNIGALFGGQPAGGQYQRSMNGMGILQHILGNRTGRVADQVSKASGLDPARVGQLMIMLAPLVMGALGKAQQSSHRQQGSNGIADMLGGLFNGGGLLGAATGRAHPQGGNSFLDAVLDRNGNGSADELMHLGSQLLGGLFGKR